MARQRGLQVGDQGLIDFGIEVAGQRERAVVDLEGGKWRQRGAGRVVIGIGRRIPVEADPSELPTDGTQVPDVHGRAIQSGDHQARPVGAKGRRCRRAQVGAFQSRQGAVRLDLDQTKDSIRILDDHQAAVGGKAETITTNLSLLLPGADRPEPARWSVVISHLPSGLNPTPTIPSIAR